MTAELLRNVWMGISGFGFLFFFIMWVRVGIDLKVRKLANGTPSELLLGKASVAIASALCVSFILDGGAAFISIFVKEPVYSIGGLILSLVARMTLGGYLWWNRNSTLEAAKTELAALVLQRRQRLESGIKRPPVVLPGPEDPGNLPLDTP